MLLFLLQEGTRCSSASQSSPQESSSSNQSLPQRAFSWEAASFVHLPEILFPSGLFWGHKWIQYSHISKHIPWKTLVCLSSGVNQWLSQLAFFEVDASHEWFLFLFLCFNVLCIYVYLFMYIYIYIYFWNFWNFFTHFSIPKTTVRYILFSELGVSRESWIRQKELVSLCACPLFGGYAKIASNKGVWTSGFG